MTPLSELLPHKPPMILLTGQEASDADGEAVGFVDIGRDSPFFEPALNGVPSCVALEYMAQAMALCVGLHRRRRGLPPQLGFVLGSRRMETATPCFREGARYRVTAMCVYQDESFGSFDCRIVDADGVVVARATLSAFQPEGDVTPEKIEEYA